MIATETTRRVVMVYKVTDAEQDAFCALLRTETERMRQVARSAWKLSTDRARSGAAELIASLSETFGSLHGFRAEFGRLLERGLDDHAQRETIELYLSTLKAIDEAAAALQYALKEPVLAN